MWLMLGIHDTCQQHISIAIYIFAIFPSQRKGGLCIKNRGSLYCYGFLAS